VARVIIHFICRGNSFRSIIAEAYLNSLEIKGWSVLSSGTAARDKARNLVYYRKTLELLEGHGIREFAKADYGDQLTQSRAEKASIAICMNQRVNDECLQIVAFPTGPRIWSVADLGEPGRVARTESEEQLYREEAYQEIVKNVSRLVSSRPPNLGASELVADSGASARTGRSRPRASRQAEIRTWPGREWV
jgi:protein-tyrosine-phosphatase